MAASFASAPELQKKTLALTGQSSKRDAFKPLLPGVKHVKYGDIKALRRAVNKRTAMVILEPIMGEAGVVTPPSGYLSAEFSLTIQM